MSFLDKMRPRRYAKCPEPLRSDTIAAWNICILKGYIPQELSFKFMPRNGKWGIEMWMGDYFNPQNGIIWTDCVEIIAAAHEPVAVIRGADH
jgi:hypothetical protein